MQTLFSMFEENHEEGGTSSAEGYLDFAPLHQSAVHTRFRTDT